MQLKKKSIYSNLCSHRGGKESTHLISVDSLNEMMALNQAPLMADCTHLAVASPHLSTNFIQLLCSFACMLFSYEYFTSSICHMSNWIN